MLIKRGGFMRQLWLKLARDLWTPARAVVSLLLCGIVPLSLLAAMAMTTNAAFAGQSPAAHDLQICPGSFALCAAATCFATGKTIKVNVTGGGTAEYPEVQCTCPVVSGVGVADLNGGNMQGSCAPPSPTQIWSIYTPRAQIPQAINNWTQLPPGNLAPPQVCAASLNVGNLQANCFSFLCRLGGVTPTGVRLATCNCPMGEDFNGNPVSAGTAFITQAGQLNKATCFDHPVGSEPP
jgi:hypothetical protein